MSMNNVDLFVLLTLAVGFTCFSFGLGAESKTRAFRALLMVLGLAIVLLPLQQRFFCIQTTPVNEEMVSESYPIAEDGVSVEATGMMWSTRTVYVVIAEQEDGSIRTLTLNASLVTVYEDAASWEDAHVDKVLEATATVEGTFFGVPVRDTQVSGLLSPVYQLHVPAGAIR